MNPLLIPTAGLLIAAAGFRSDLLELQGTWVLVSREVGGKLESEDEIKGRGDKIRVKGGTLYTERGGRVSRIGTFTLRTGETPKAIALTIPDASRDGATATLWGIYELEDDTLRICLSQPGDVKTVLTYEREKARP